MDPNQVGHRQRLRDRFLSGAGQACTDPELLEILLGYALPRRDVAPLARGLLEKFRTLRGVLTADFGALVAEKGMTSATATLLRLIGSLTGPSQPPVKGKIGHPKALQRTVKDSDPPTPVQLTLKPSEGQVSHLGPTAPQKEESLPPKPSSKKPPESHLFGKSVLEEAIKLAPLAPLTEELNVLREFFQGNLHFSAQLTRQRYSSYILKRLFPSGHPDKPLLQFAHLFSGSREWREVAFHRFLRAEPLLTQIILELVLPSVGRGKILRQALREYLHRKFPDSRAIDDCLQAAIDAGKSGGIWTADRREVSFSFREPLPRSFAFILHDEFPTPGMYDIPSILVTPRFSAMLWNPDRLLPMCYALRNRGILAKVSEIDTVRQVSTRFTPTQLIDYLEKPREME